MSYITGNFNDLERRIHQTITGLSDYTGYLAEFNAYAGIGRYITNASGKVEKELRRQKYQFSNSGTFLSQQQSTGYNYSGKYVLCLDGTYPFSLTGTLNVPNSNISINNSGFKSLILGPSTGNGIIFNVANNNIDYIKVFNSNTTYSSLVAHHNRIPYFGNYPQFQSSMDNLDLSFNLMTNFDFNFYKETVSMTVNNNNLTSLVMGGSSMEYLDASHNNLTSALFTGGNNGYNNMYYCGLNSNNLTNINIQPLSKVATLLLNDNKLSSVSMLTSADQTNWSAVNFSNNNLSLAMVDYILTGLAASNINGDGELDLRNNSKPGPNGSAAAAYLIGLGWAILVDA